MTRPSIFNTIEKYTPKIWQDLGYSTDPLPISLSGLADSCHTPGAALNESRQLLETLYNDLLEIGWRDPLDRMVNRIRQNQDLNTGELARDPEILEAFDRQQTCLNLQSDLTHASTTLTLIDEFREQIPTAKIEQALTEIDTIWRFIVEHRPDRKHPIAPLIKAVLIAKVEPQRRKKSGLMPHNIKDSFPTGQTQGELFDVGSFPQAPREIQGVLPGFEFPGSELVPALPLVAYDAAGGKTKSGRGAPIDQRLFVNLLIEYPKHERFGVARLSTTFQDILDWLYPNGTTDAKKVLIPRLQTGFKNLHNLWFEWERRAWNIIAVDALPMMHTKREDPLTFTIRMPEGMNTGGGASIGLTALRTYGAQSAPKFRAWVRLAYLWDAAKIRNGGSRIYATIPEVLRNNDSYLVDAKGEVILTGNLYKTKHGWKSRQGNLPQTPWYHPLAIKTGRQIHNPQADKVPILDDADMVKLFYDHDKRKGEAFRKALHDARRHAEGMVGDGHIAIEHDAIDQRTSKKGWRILEPYTSILPD